MLVLTRKCGESLVLHDSQSAERAITITVVEVRGGRVKLGIQADPDIEIQREEVWQRLREVNQLHDVPCISREGELAPNH